MANSPLIFKGQNAQMIPSGTILLKSGSPISVPQYADFASLPGTANEGDSAIAIDTGTLYIYFSGTWQVAAAPGVILLVGALDGQAKNANAATVNANTIYLQTADATWPGVLTAADWTTFNNKEPAITAATTADYYRGDKTFQPLTADVVAYTPAVAGDWNPAPTDVSSALDQLAVSNPNGLVMHVAKNGDDTSGTGSAQKPFLTIQAALNAIGSAASAADVKIPGTVIIAPGAYDESLTIPDGRIITLLGQGTVILGDGAGANWSSTVARSIDFSPTNAGMQGSDLRPALNIGVYLPGDTTSTFISEAAGFFISGDITLNGVGITHTLNLHGVKLQGQITKTSLGLTNFLAYRSYFVGALNLSSGSSILERIEDCQFDALITVDGYNYIQNSEIKAGMTTVTGLYNTLPPNGIYNTTFSGTYTGPASTFKIDLATDYFFRANGGALAGGATKVIISPYASGTVDGILSFTDWTTFNSKQDAGNYITDLTGDVTASGPGSVAATIANSAVTNAKMADMSSLTIKSNITGGAAAPADNSLSAILDAALSSTQGSVIYRGAASWSALGPGTNGEFLQTQGAVADPIWAAPAGSGTVNAGTAGRLALYPANGTTVDDQYTQNANLIDILIASHATLAASRTYTIPDAGADASFVMTESAQTINGLLTLAAVPLLKAGLDIEDPGVGTFKVSIIAPTLAASYTLTLPVDDGTSGQVLSTDGSGVLSWVDQSSLASPLTTKGDIWVFSTLDARLAVGTDGQILSANSAQATGLEWIDNPAITSLTGDVTASGPGAAAATIANSAVTNAKMADMAANTIKGNNTGGVAAPSDLTAAQVTAMLDIFVGDSGTGGTKGLVPAPAAGDAAASKFLKADGLWTAISSLSSPLTTKGDIWIFSTVDARLPIGTDGQVLSANSAQATGLEWIDAPSASPTVFGSRGVPRDIVAANGIDSADSHMSTTAVNQVIFMQGSGGAVDISANPQIEAHTVVGARMTLIGRSDTNTVQLDNGTGLELNGSAILMASDVLELMWDGTVWVELGRNF